MAKDCLNLACAENRLLINLNQQTRCLFTVRDKLSELPMSASLPALETNLKNTSNTCVIKRKKKKYCHPAVHLPPPALLLIMMYITSSSTINPTLEVCLISKFATCLLAFRLTKMQRPVLFVAPGTIFVRA